MIFLLEKCVSHVTKQLLLSPYFEAFGVFQSSGSLLAQVMVEGMLVKRPQESANCIRTMLAQWASNSGILCMEINTQGGFMIYTPPKLPVPTVYYKQTDVYK